MEITGKIIKIYDPVTGESKRGQWKKQNFVIETTDDYPKKICFTVWNDKADISSLTETDIVKVFFNIESREYNDNWYTDLKAWKTELAESGGSKQYIEDSPPLEDMEIPPELPEENGDELPF